MPETITPQLIESSEWMEDMRESWRLFNKSELTEAIDHQMMDRIEGLLRACQTVDYDRHGLKAAEYSLGLTAMAADLLRSGGYQAYENPFGTPWWYERTHGELLAYTRDDTGMRKLLKSTHFFNLDSAQQRRFCVSVSASVRPAQNYEDGIAFIAGVAAGSITCVPDRPAR